MKRVLTLLLVLLASGPVAAQEADDPEYDPQLAEELGADDYGMASYVIAFLKSGPNQELEAEEQKELMRAHLDNIGRMAEEGTLVLAGPFAGHDELRGLYVFDVTSVEEARELTETDPAIAAGVLSMELVGWYGSAGLRELYEIHQQIAKKSP